ncbi:MAG TPA: XrtA system polysaccharide chain length determinant [Candidatus Acidoferrum sp.]|nr:XrtA system polysaccharide chain length determinant [Candidatus Acidoferrum sp.]
MNSAETKRTIGLAMIIEVVRRRFHLAVVPFLFVMAAGLSLAMFLPSLWTAKSTILVDRQKIPESFVKSTITTDVEAQLLGLSQQIMSSGQLMKIIEAHDLYPNLRGKRSADEVVERMRRDIRIEVQNDDRDKRNPRTVGFSVLYTTTTPKMAMTIANELAALYVNEDVRYREKHSVSASEFLDTQLKDVRERLQNQERRVAEFKERNMGELPEQREANLRTLDRLQQQLQSAQETLRRANERRQLLTQTLAEVDQSNTTVSGPGGTPNPSPAEAAAARLSVLKQELTQMQSRYNDKYPDVVALKDQIKALEAKIAAEPAAAARETQAKSAATGARKDGKELRAAPQNSYVQNLLQQLDQATIEARTSTDEVKGLREQIALYQRRIENTPRREQESAQITRDYESTRELFRSLLGKRGEAEMAADLEQRQQGEHFRIIDAAGLPDRPAGPNRFRVVLVALVLALGISGIAVVIAEHTDTSYRSAEEVRTFEGVPVLSTIPKIVTERDRRRRLRLRRLGTAAVAVGLLAVIGSSFALAHNNHALVASLSSEPVSVPKNTR